MGKKDFTKPAGVVNATNTNKEVNSTLSFSAIPGQLKTPEQVPPAPAQTIGKELIHLLMPTVTCI